MRRAETSDQRSVLEILEEADLLYPSNVLDGFWLAVSDGRTVGVVRLQEEKDFIFLTSLGVRTDSRDQGVASVLMRSIIVRADKPIYLYTIIPDFFSKFGFITVPRPAYLPPKEIYGCDECFPERCVTMRRDI